MTMVRSPYTRNTSIEGSDWRDQAECLKADPELFFPTTIMDVNTIEKAQAICGRCAVHNACLEYALRTGQDSGIWGGLTEEERKAMKRRAIRRRR